jgi:hypothetical protein
MQAEKLGERWLGAVAMGFELCSCDGEKLRVGGRGTYVLLFIGQGVQQGRGKVAVIITNRIGDPFKI